MSSKGSWSAGTYASIKQNYSTKSQAQVFTSKGMPATMDPKGVAFRESRDSAEYPESLAVMLFLDETGSMGDIPEHLVKHKLGALMETLITHNLKQCHVMFGGIGDAKGYEAAPLQVGQFEAETKMLDEWLTKIYLEGIGGGNNGESYHLAWLFAARHTSIDCFEKRGTKGFLFTIGDEEVHPILTAGEQQRYLGYTEAQDLKSEDLLKEAQNKYHVYHLIVNSPSPHIKNDWRALMGENAIVVDDADAVAEVIATTIAVVNGADLASVVKDFDAKTAGIVTNALATLKKDVAKNPGKGVMAL